MTNGAAWGVLVLRIVLGVILVMHGSMVFSTYTPRGAASLVTRIGYPPWSALILAWYLIVVHVVGGALIVVGFWTRLAAVLNLPIMASAVLLMHLSQGFFMRGVVRSTTDLAIVRCRECDCSGDVLLRATPGKPLDLTVRTSGATTATRVPAPQLLPTANAARIDFGENEIVGSLSLNRSAR